MKKYDHHIPDSIPTPEEVAKQQKINLEIIKQEITNHVNFELDRFSKEVNKIKNQGSL